MQPTEPMDPRDPRNATTNPGYYGDNPAPNYYADGRPAPVEPVESAPPASRVSPDNAYAPSWRGWRAAQVIYMIGSIVETLIIIRAVLKLLAANPDAGFSSLIYSVTDPLVAPFQGVFATPQSHGSSVLDMAAILALIVYALVIWGITRLLELMQRRTANPA